MIVVSNRIKVAEGHEKEFEARFEGRARLVEHMPGLIRLEILRPLRRNRESKPKRQVRNLARNRPRAEIFAGPNVFEMHEVIQRAEKNG